jgi:hypothetical protein
VELRGNLKDFSLPDIIQLLGFGRKTGVLQVDGADGTADGAAALYFEEGSVVHAECFETEGEEAVYRLFRVPQGEFRFHGQTLPPDRTIEIDSTNLLMEAARLLDEASRDHGFGGIDDAIDGSETSFDVECRDPGEIKQDLKSYLKRRFGRGAKRPSRAVDRCGDSVEELIDLAGRLEKYIHLFLDGGSSQSLGQEIRELISGSSSSSW